MWLDPILGFASFEVENPHWAGELPNYYIEVWAGGNLLAQACYSPELAFEIGEEGWVWLRG